MTSSFLGKKRVQRIRGEKSNTIKTRRENGKVVEFITKVRKLQ